MPNQPSTPAKGKTNAAKADWGESGPSFAIAQERVIIATARTVIALNARGFSPKNQAEQQKQRTFVNP